MSQKRIEAGYCYHLYNQGVDKTDLFKDDENYFFFLNKYKKYLSDIVRTYAYVLLPNHFHFLVYVPLSDVAERPDPAQVFSNLFNSYAQSFNLYWNRRGSLFDRHLKRVVVQSKSHVLRLICYIHHNPLKHGIYSDFRAYPYSSYQSFTGKREDIVTLDTNYILNLFGGENNFRKSHNEIEEDLIDRLTLEREY